jgi:hypothetical protein
MWAVVALILVGSVIIGCTAPASDGPSAASDSEVAPAGEGESLVQGRCTECHDLTRVEQASKSLDSWEQTISRMVDNGADLSEDEQAIVAAYLTEMYGL